MDTALATLPPPMLRLRERSDQASSNWPLLGHDEQEEEAESDSEAAQPAQRRGASLWRLYHYVDEVLTTSVRAAEIQAQR